MKRLCVVFAVLLLLPYPGISQTMKEINKPTISALDEVAPFSEGLAAVRKGNQWGFIDKTGKLVIDFRNDVVWNKNADTTRTDVKGIRYPQFKNGLCPIQETKEDGILQYGFMAANGQIVIKPEYLNITEFEDGKAVGIYCKTTFRGKNNFQLNIYDYSFTEVVVNTGGEILWPIGDREGILMTKRRYEIPELRAILISKNLLAVRGKDSHWQIRKINL
ncbi:MAG: WG repeat-containing protein [Saonia sp.]